MRHVLGLALGLGVLFFAGLGAAWAQGGEAGAPPPPIDETRQLWVLFTSGGFLKPGSIGLCEVPIIAGTCSTLSDVLIFENKQVPNVGLVGLATFYSDLESGEIPSGADTGIPNVVPDKLFQELANGLNGAEVFDYIPGPNDPGAQFDTTGKFFAGLVYSITSDPCCSDLIGVPEPSTIALVVTGLGPCVLGYLRARVRARNSPRPV